MARDASRPKDNKALARYTFYRALYPLKDSPRHSSYRPAFARSNVIKLDECHVTNEDEKVVG